MMGGRRIRIPALAVMGLLACAVLGAATDAMAQTRRVKVMDGGAQTVTARNGETLDLVFGDGTSLLLGPGGSLSVKETPQSIALSGSQAVLRVATGQPGRARPVTLTTPQATLRLSEGSAVVVMDRESTRAHLLIRGDMTVAHDGGPSRKLYRPGFHVTAAANRVSRPTRMTGPEIVRDLERIAPGLGRRLGRASGLRWPNRVQVAQSGGTVAPPVLIAELTDATGTDVTDAEDGECGSDEAPGAASTDCLLAVSLTPGEINRVGIDDVTVDTPNGNNGGGATTTTADFTDGFGFLGLGDYYAGANNTLSVVAQGSTTITDGATTDTFQQMTGTFIMSEDEFFDDVTLLFTDQVNTPPGILPGGVGPRRFGPTTGTIINTGNWDSVGDPNAATPLSTAPFDANGGPAYLLGNPAITLGGQRILVIRRRDSATDDISGNFAFHDILSFQRFKAVAVQPDIADDTDPLFDPGDFSDFFSNVFSNGTIDPKLAFGISLGGHIPKNSRDQDNFLFVEVVDALMQDFAIGPGLANSPPLLNFIGNTPPGLVMEQNLVVVRPTVTEPTFRVTIPDLANPRSLLFAAGDLDGLVFSSQTGNPLQPFAHQGTYPDTAVTYDRFQIAGSLMNWFGDTNGWGPLSLPDPDAAVRQTSRRSFLRNETWTDLGSPTTPLDVADLTDRGTYVVNPAAPLVDINGILNTAPGNVAPEGAQSTLLHADFGLANVGGQQVSSLSATIGSVSYRIFVEDYHGDLDVNGDPLADISGDAIIHAQTVGSSSAGAASTLLFSDWQSTAAGGGNPNIDLPLNGFAPDGIPDPGRLGAFVLENAGTTFDDIIGPGSQTWNGGLERPVGVDPARPDQTFGAVRLGIAAEGGLFPDRTPGRFGGGLSGYATGWVEVETGGGGSVGLAPFARVASGPNLTIDAPDAVFNTISGHLQFGGSPIQLGGTETVSGQTVARGAFVDDLTWGMLSTTPGTQVALISAEPIARELRGQFTTSTNAQVPVPTADTVGSLGGGVDDAYDYAQWGVFFGDLVDSDGSRQHVHLGSFAAGSPIPRAVLDTASGQAIYNGHAIGNVYDGGAARTAMGTFSENFDFDTRTGKTAMDFDRRSYSGNSTLTNGAYASTVTGGNRSGNLNGRFVGGMSGGKPNALVGGFEIQNNASSPGAAYRATGTFVGER